MPQPPMGTGENDRGTPHSLFDPLHARYQFTLDGAASHENALLPAYSTLDGTFDKVGRGWYVRSWQDGLEYPWGPLERVWINPPYGRGLLEPFVRKAATSAALVVALLPVRTDQFWFHEYVLNAGARITWLRGRVRYDGLKVGAPFPSMIVTWPQIDSPADKV